MKHIKIEKMFGNNYVAKVNDNLVIYDLQKELAEYILELQILYNMALKELVKSDKKRNEALTKINNMFDNVNEIKIIYDLLELEKILKEENNE